VYGLTSVTNAVAAIPGRLRETDPQYKERHTAAVATSGEDDIAGIYSAVSEVSGVSDCRVIEAVGSITVSVIGGSDADVAAAINNNRTGGIPSLGDQSVDVYSAITGETTTERFYRAVDREFFVALTLAKNKALFPDDGELQIKNALVAMALATYRINGTVDYRALQAPVYSVAGVTISDLRIGWTAAPTGITNLTTTIQQRAALPIENISISFVTT
jgi:uncharacterized phage protein gp47/JayE